jgi:homoserine kinase type II
MRVWEGVPVLSVAPVSGGTVNWNFDVRTAGGRFFLRCYRQNLETERIEGEHSLIAWAAGKGIPAPVPLTTRAGKTITENGAQRWALFPWMDGACIERGTLSPAQARALGDLHGRVQAALAVHPDSAGAKLSQRWDKTQSLELLTRLVARAEERGVEGWIVDGVRRQRQLLDALEVQPPDYFSSLPCQLLHGDFHDQQVLFEGDRVTALVDWEIWHTDPRAWELVRSLAFSKVLDSPLLEDYLAGYREHIQLSEEEVRLALKLWFQSRLVGLWAWWAYLFEGNDRVKDFFPEAIRDLDRVTDNRWTEGIAGRLVRAAC